ncbi:MAG: hypothetical protein ACI9J2_001912 [Saprospiraceae bacterium]|jgi:hypothetical protein
MTLKTISKVIDPKGHQPNTEKMISAIRLTHKLVGLIGLFSFMLSGSASALKPTEEISLEKRLRATPAHSVDDIARKIRQQHKWRILAAEPTVSDDKTFYRFKLLNKKRGRVSVVVIDPNEPNLNTLN